MTDNPEHSSGPVKTDSGSLPDAALTDGGTLIIDPARSLPGRTIGSTEAPVRQVGRYQVIEKLGEGATASVYKAYDPSIDRQLVIKFLHPELCRDDETRNRFLREAKAAGVLSHPNIVTVFDVGEIEGRPYIAMELLDGGPLSESLVEGQGLPTREVVSIGLQLASALAYAHSRGVVHRDLKPSNIIRLSGSGTVKLADFGIAQISTTEAGEQTGTVLGTPYYMSPEQATGASSDARSDLWAVGVILFQLISGRRPFVADSVDTLLYRIVNESPKPPVEEIGKNIPAALRRAVARCLKKKIDKRLQNARELEERLVRVQRELELEEEAKRAVGGIPMKAKLALGMAALVAIMMAVTSTFVTQRQYQAMLNETVGHGASLAKLLAVESAAPALSEDWVGIDVFAQEVARAIDLRGLSVADRAGIVRVSTDPKAVGQHSPEQRGQSVLSRDTDVAVLRQEHEGGSVFSFETAIRFQGKQVGKIHLALPEEPLAAVARQSWRLMLLLLAITVAAVGLATYIVFERYSRSLRRLRESLAEIGEGRFDCRIGEQRRDEIGQIYRAFDAMAARLEIMSDAGKLGRLEETTLATNHS
jgi:tRNA A-37 threonylcarbamoyl transferase component Bud32/HAMP domain-containing protein